MKRRKLFKDKFIGYHTFGLLVNNSFYKSLKLNLPDPYLTLYLTFEALEDTVFSIEFENDSIINVSITPVMRESFSYSIDNGETWETFTTPNDAYSGAALTTPTIHSGEKVLWKGVGIQNYVGGPTGAHCFFSSTGTFIAYGNIMSIVRGDDFIGDTDLSDTTLPFYNLFNSNLVSVENLILPATTLAENCYRYMFYNCTSLIDAPKLPATTLVKDCYTNMFDGCTSLTTAPELPATILALGCYGGMFTGCQSLTTAPELPATTLANYCYNHMFDSCTSLTTAPELPTTTLAQGCYNFMFNRCTSLTTAPELPATTLAEYCYSNMFYGCTGLTTAPVLPATTLVLNCYSDMFNGCRNLNYIKAMFTTTPSTDYTLNWVDGVSQTGTFVKNSAATWDVTGVKGIPYEWTVETADA